MVIVSVAVIDRTTIDDERVVEQVAVTIWSFTHLLQKVRELFAVVAIDLGDLFDVVLLVLVVGELMVTVLDLDHREGTIATFVGKHKASDASGVGSEGQDHQVVHEPNVFGRIAWFLARCDGSFG